MTNKNENNYVLNAIKDIEEYLAETNENIRALRDDEYYSSHGMDCELCEDQYRKDLRDNFEWILMRAEDRGCCEASLRAIIKAYEPNPDNLDYWLNWLND